MMRRGILLVLPLGLLVLAVGCPPRDPNPSSSNDGSEKNTATPGELRPRVEAALASVKGRELLTTHAFWTIFHAILGMGFETTLVDPPVLDKDGKVVREASTVNAIDYICSGAKVRGMEFIPTLDGLDVATGKQIFVGQGHQDQFIAEMAQWGIARDKKFMVNGKEYTFLDFVNHCRARASTTKNQELSWAIVIIADYFGTDHAWTNNLGEKLHFEDIVRYEVDQPIDEAACGGTHRLFGITWALHRHLQKGGPVTGVWLDAAHHLEKYKDVARKTQNSDGSFSTEYFKSPANAKDAGNRIASTGHIFEWLALYLTDSELEARWVRDAASALAVMILDNQEAALEFGSLYHAAHGLAMYHARLWGVPESHGPLIPLPPKK